MPVVVTGVPGVGASQVCERARHTLGEEYTLINFGDVMLEEALEHGLTDSREGIAALPVRDQRMLQRRAGEYVARRATEGSLLVNTHLVVHTDHGFLPGLPDAVRADLNPSVFVVVDAEPGAIRRRRERAERSYASTGTAVDFHRQLQSAAAFAYSAASDTPVRHVSNDDDSESAAEELATIVETTQT